MLRARYCPNCKHETAQRKGKFVLEHGTAIESTNASKWTVTATGFICLGCGNVLMEITETKVYPLRIEV